jgi:hypothetical protein
MTDPVCKPMRIVISSVPVSSRNAFKKDRTEG